MRDFGPEFHCAGRCAMYLLWLESRIKDFLCTRMRTIANPYQWVTLSISFIPLFLLYFLY